MKNVNTSKQNRWELLVRILQWIPVYVTLLVLPFVTYYKVFESRLYGTPYYTKDPYNYDFGLYHKQFLFFFIVGALVLLIGFLCYKNRFELKNNFRTQRGILIPLSIYLIFAFLSSVCCDYRYGALTGTDSLFQGFFALLGYVLLAVYFLFVIKTEKDVTLASIALAIGAFLQALLGVLQYAGMNLYEFDWYQKLITPDGYLEAVGPVVNRMENMVALCANNPNYAGVLLAILLSVSFGVLMTERRVWVLVADALLFTVLFIALLGTGSEASLFIFVVAAVIGIIFRLRKIWKYWYLIIPAATLVIEIILLAANFAQLPVVDNIKNALTVEKQDPNPLSRMVTNKTGIEITYMDVPFTVKVQMKESSYLFGVWDENGKEMNLVASEDNNYYYVEHKILGNGVLKIQAGAYEGMPLIALHMNNRQWNFVSVNGTSYYILNPYGHLETLQDDVRLGFYGYETLASNRGLIWSHTLPRLKNTLFLGVGANNFIHLYPQNNYKDTYYYAGEMQVMSKPHSMYLQIAAETGVISLLAMLAFWGYYIVQSAKLYWSSNFDSFSKRLGFGCFLAVLVYLGCGISNDSMISVAPIFWCIQGVGLAVNFMNKKNSVE